MVFLDFKKVKCLSNSPVILLVFFLKWGGSSKLGRFRRVVKSWKLLRFFVTKSEGFQGYFREKREKNHSFQGYFRAKREKKLDI